jgi:hypothetical protein
MHNDVLGGSRTLRNAKIIREEFNPANDEHLSSLRIFLDTGNWGRIQFYPQAPYVTIPETVLRKMAEFGLTSVGK